MDKLTKVVYLEENALKVIKIHGKKGISAKNLLAKTRDLNKTNRDAFILSLINSGKIKVKKFRINKSRRASTFYFWIGK